LITSVIYPLASNDRYGIASVSAKSAEGDDISWTTPIDDEETDAHSIASATKQNKSPSMVLPLSLLLLQMIHPISGTTALVVLHLLPVGGMSRPPPGVAASFHE
jgi:hypothetical protein